MTGPAYHARTHRPGGTDPIHGLDEVPYVVLFGSATVPHGTGVTNIALFPFNSDYTDRPDIFGLDNVAIAGGHNPGTFQGLTILQTGLYRATKAISIPALLSDTTVRPIQVYQASGSGFDVGGILFGSREMVIGGSGTHMEHWAMTDPTIGEAIILGVSNSDTADRDVNVALEVIRLSETPLDFT